MFQSRKFLVLFFSINCISAIEIKQLQCELQLNPVGVAVTQPVFGWLLTFGEKNDSQSAYEIEVLDVWNSGKQLSDESVNVLYNDPTLQSFTHYKWRARV
ncbi:MAG: hypothetical protein JZU53_14185 [Paludibacter sp.]|nr:hypothetical protein [Paludibacter sp.]